MMIVRDSICLHHCACRSHPLTGAEYCFHLLRLTFRPCTLYLVLHHHRLIDKCNLDAVSSEYEQVYRCWQLARLHVVFQKLMFLHCARPCTSLCHSVKSRAHNSHPTEERTASYSSQSLMSWGPSYRCILASHASKVHCAVWNSDMTLQLQPLQFCAHS